MSTIRIYSSIVVRSMTWKLILSHSMSNNISFTYSIDRDWGEPPDQDRFRECAAVSVDSEDNVWVFNIPTKELLKFSSDGRLLDVWPEHFENVHGIDFDKAGNIYIVDRNEHRVLKYTPGGSLVAQIGNKGQPSDTGYSLDKGRETNWRDPVERAAHPFNVPTGVRIARNGEIYVSNGYANCRVHRFSVDGTLIQSWGQPGKSNPGEFHLVHGLYIDSLQRILVCDRENDRVQIFDLYGDFLEIWKGFAKASCIHEGPDNEYVVTEHLGRVSLLDRNGNIINRWGNGQENSSFPFPHGCAIDSKGNIYIGHVTKSGAPAGSGNRLVRLTRQ